MVERNAPLAIAAGKTAVSFDPSSGRLRAERPGCAWAWDEAYEPAFLTAAGERVPFGAAREKTFLARETSLEPELVCRYADFPGAGEVSFETGFGLGEIAGALHLEWPPLAGAGQLSRVLWPGPMAFGEPRPDWQTVLPLRQGLLIPNGWETPVGRLPFDGRFGTADAYLPWFGQLREGNGYLLLCDTPADAGYRLDQRENNTRVGVWLDASLGKLTPRRFRYLFFEHCTYNELCRAYREIVREEGRDGLLLRARVRRLRRGAGGGRRHLGRV